MTVTERTIPNSLFSVEENGEAISITAENGWIYVTLSEGGRIRKADEFSFIGFKNALQRLCCDVPLSTPSSDDKTPTVATGEAENRLLKEGDKVMWGTAELFWTIQTVHPNGLVDVIMEKPAAWNRVRYEDLILMEAKP